jgi:tetratricopeptide (TPR) repeat protein
MSPTEPTDVHARYVQELIDAADWAGLVRYWLAHQHQPALDAALDVVRRRADPPEGRWRELAEFLTRVREDPFDPRHPPPERFLAGSSAEEQATLYLLTLNPRAALCEFAAEAPVEQQEQLFQIGLEAVEEACQAAAFLEDRASQAFFRGVQARGFQEVRQLEAARASYQEALASYRELARLRPEVYRPAVATTLNNLGNVQSALNDLEAARASYQEALASYRELARLRPEVYRPGAAQRRRAGGDVLPGAQRQGDGVRGQAGGAAP